MLGAYFDPMVILACESDPDMREWAVRELAAAGFAEPAQIERDLRPLAVRP